MSESETPDGSWIPYSGKVRVGWTREPDGTFKSNEPVVVVPPKPWIRLIDKGPFYDRFGALKMAILTNSDPGVRAIIMDLNVREYVDLDRIDVFMALKYIQTIIPSLNDGIINNIISINVGAHENFALRTKFFQSPEV
jgi:DNA-directed RNA polymerase